MFLLTGFILLCIGIFAFCRLALISRVSRCIFEMPIISGKENSAKDITISPAGACRLAISAEISGEMTTLVSGDSEHLGHQLQYNYPLNITLFGPQGQVVSRHEAPLDSNINALKTVEFDQTNESSGRTHFEVSFGKFSLSSSPIEKIIAKIDQDSQYQSKMENAMLKIYDHIPRPFITLATATLGTAAGLILITLELSLYVSSVIR